MICEHFSRAELLSPPQELPNFFGYGVYFRRLFDTIHAQPVRFLCYLRSATPFWGTNCCFSKSAAGFSSEEFAFSSEENGFSSEEGDSQVRKEILKWGRSLSSEEGDSQVRKEILKWGRRFSSEEGASQVRKELLKIRNVASQVRKQPQKLSSQLRKEPQHTVIIVAIGGTILITSIWIPRSSKINNNVRLWQYYSLWLGWGWLGCFGLCGVDGNNLIIVLELVWIILVALFRRRHTVVVA